MKLHRCHWALIASAIILGTFATTSHAQFRYFYQPMGPFVRSPLYVPSYSTYSYSYNPYVAPYPAYGILPGPVVLNGWQYGDSSSYAGRTAQDYGYGDDHFATPPRKRTALYPAVPFERAPGEALADIRRVRFEINVPYENAVVLIDGVATKQTGLSRVYVTPPMDEDRLFTSVFEIRWTDDQGKVQSIQRTFEFVAGETIRHTFK